MLVVEDKRSAVVGVEGNCAVVVEVVVPIAVADVDVVVVAVVAVVVDAFVVAVVGGLVAVQLASRLWQEHRGGLVEQSCGFR